MKNMTLIAIDPGKKGALAVRDHEGRVHVEKLDTDSLKDLWDQIASYGPTMDTREVFCLMEKVGTGRPGNAARAMTTFARHCGNVEAFLTAARIPFDEILPTSWMNGTVGKIRSKEKADRKREIKAYVQKLFPDIRVTLDNADALGILVYLMKHRGVM